ncbi:MAG: hypothetical protein ACJA13_001902 [Paraglaciecola sp.]|jgi:hypothetical protein
MSYTMKATGDKLCIEFNGVLNALDLILLNQSDAYKSALKDAHKMMLDFSPITGSELNEADIHGLLMLSKLDSQKVQNIQLFIITAMTNSEAIEQLCTQIFAQSSWQVSVFDNRRQADSLFNR